MGLLSTRAGSLNKGTLGRLNMASGVNDIKSSHQERIEEGLGCSAPGICIGDDGSRPGF